MRFVRAIGYGILGVLFGALLGLVVGVASGLIAYVGVSLYMGRRDPGMLSISVVLCSISSVAIGALSGLYEGCRLGWRGALTLRELLFALWRRYFRATLYAGK